MYNYMKQCKVLFLVLHEGQAQIFYFVCIILSNFYSSKNKLNLSKFICKGSKDLLQGIFLGFENRNCNLAFLAKNKKQFQATLLSPMNQDLQSKLVFKIFGMMIAEANNCMFSYIPSEFLSMGIVQTTQSKIVGRTFQK